MSWEERIRKEKKITSRELPPKSRKDHKFGGGKGKERRGKSYELQNQ